MRTLPDPSLPVWDPRHHYASVDDYAKAIYEDLATWTWDDVEAANRFYEDYSSGYATSSGDPSTETDDEAAAERIDQSLPGSLQDASEKTFEAELDQTAKDEPL